MGEPSVQVATDFGDPRISVAGEDGARDVCRESRSVSTIVDNSPQWSMQHNRRIVVEHALGDSVIIRLYHTTGFGRDEIIDLCMLINSAERGPDFRIWPPILGLFKSVAVTLTYMRHNRTQAGIGEPFGVFQTTISRRSQ